MPTWLLGTGGGPLVKSVSTLAPTCPACDGTPCAKCLPHVGSDAFASKCPAHEGTNGRRANWHVVVHVAPLVHIFRISTAHSHAFSQDPLLAKDGQFSLDPPSTRGSRGSPECVSFRLFGMSHKCRISLHEHVAPLAEGWLSLSQRQRQWMSIRPVLLGRSMFVRTEMQGTIQRALRCPSKRVPFSRCKGTQTVNSKQAHAARDRRLGGGAWGGLV